MPRSCRGRECRGDQPRRGAHPDRPFGRPIASRAGNAGLESYRDGNPTGRRPRPAVRRGRSLHGDLLDLGRRARHRRRDGCFRLRGVTALGASPCAANRALTFMGLVSAAIPLTFFTSQAIPGEGIVSTFPFYLIGPVVVEELGVLGRKPLNPFGATVPDCATNGVLKNVL